MKKLALVIVLTVLATRLLSQDHQPPRPPDAPRPVAVKFRRLDRVAQFPGQVPDVAAPVVPAPPFQGPGAVAPPEVLVQVEPGPSPEEPIRVIPWRGSRPNDRARRLPGPLAPKADGMPAWFPRAEAEEAERARADDSGVRVLLGRLSATPDRAKQDLRQVLEREVAAWLAADVPASWKAPADALDRMVLETYVQAVTRSFKPSPGEATPDPGSPEGLRSLDELYTLYRAGQRLDFSPTRRALLVDQYRQDVAAWRMRWLGVGVAVVLVVLAIVSAYIRTDEATKGYYTNHLRASALAALGAAGAAAYYALA